MMNLPGVAAVMAPFLMVVGIVWVTTRAKLEEKRIAAAAARPDDRDRARDSARIGELEERVRILERIVTDGGYDLAHKIEALRDERPIEQRLTALERQETI